MPEREGMWSEWMEFLQNFEKSQGFEVSRQGIDVGRPTPYYYQVQYAKLRQKQLLAKFVGGEYNGLYCWINIHIADVFGGGVELTARIPSARQRYTATMVAHELRSTGVSRHIRFDYVN